MLINKATKNFRFKILKDGSFFAWVPDKPGVWANAKSKTACLKELYLVILEQKTIIIN